MIRLPLPRAAHLLGALALLSPAAALACSPVAEGHVPLDRPITVHPDGSFVDASDDDGWNDLSGRPIRDVGGGRVGQAIESRTCDTSERLLLVDCAAGSALLLDGIPQDALPEAERDPEVFESVRALLPPYGPLDLAAQTTLADVAALADREGWSYRTDVEGFAAAHGPRNRFDPFMGCRIFYPGSPGAGG